MSEKSPTSNDSGRSSPTLYLKDSSSAYGVSRYDADQTDRAHDDDDRSTTALNPRKRQSSSEGFPVGLQRRPWLGVRRRMAIFLLLAALCICIHHSFYTFLNGRPVSDGPLSVFREQLHAGMGEQALAITIGNALAVVAKACLGGAVVTAFEQLFWWRLKKGAKSLEQIDTILAFRSNPLDPTSATAWLLFPSLSAIAFLAAAFVVVPVAAPGALTVNPAAQRSAPCMVPTVDLTGGPLWTQLWDEIPSGPDCADSQPTSVMPQLVSSVLMTRNFLPPRTPELSDLTAYNISFRSLVAVCENITGSSTVDLESYLPYSPDGIATVWNVTYLLNATLVVAARSLGVQLLTNPPQPTQYITTGVELVSCAPRSATYDVTVQPGMAGSDARVLIRSVTLLPPIPAEKWSATLQYRSIYESFACVLNGSTTAFYDGKATTFGGNFAAYSALAFGSTLVGDASMRRTDLLHVLPSLMQNISLSLLSGLPASPDGLTALIDVETTCLFSGVRFQYNRVRLLGTYLVAGTCALSAVLLAFIVVGQNGGVGESFAFSRVVGAGMDLRERVADLHGAEGEADVTLKTRVRLEDKPYGSLVPQ